MKTYLLTFLIIAIILHSIQSIAQPVLACSLDFEPVAISSNQDSIFEGEYGENVIWDFTDLVVPPFTYYGILDPSTTPYFSFFPEADFVVFDYNQYYNNYKCDGTSFSQLGGMSATYDNVYSDHHDLLRYPFTYLSSFVDTFVSPDRWGTDSVLADGYGTLMLPFGTFENVLRVRNIENFNFDSSSIPRRAVHFRFFIESFFFPIFQVVHETAGIATFHRVAFTDPNAVGMNSENEMSNTYLYPNPSAGKVNFSGLKRGASVNIYSTTGLLVRSEIFKYENNSIDVSQLSNGIYIVHIITGDSTKVLKLEIVH